MKIRLWEVAWDSCEGITVYKQCTYINSWNNTQFILELVNCWVRWRIKSGVLKAMLCYKKLLEGGGGLGDAGRGVGQGLCMRFFFVAEVIRLFVLVRENPGCSYSFPECVNFHAQTKNNWMSHQVSSKYRLKIWKWDMYTTIASAK